MLTAVRNKTIAIAEILHLKIFGHEIGGETRKFLNDLSWSFWSGVFSAGAMFIVSVLAGRWLGPAEYGKYGLVISIVSILVIPMTLGIDTASTHYISKAKFAEEKKGYIGSSTLTSSVFIVAITILGLIFSDFLVDLFATQNVIVHSALIFSLFLAVKNISNSFIRGLRYFKLQALIKILEAALILLMFVLFVPILSLLNFQSYVFAVLSGYALTDVITMYSLKKWLNFSIKYTKKIVSYGFYGILGSLFGIMINSFDKIFINKHIGSEQLGVYMAYSTVSVVFVNQLIATFINVFFPYLSANQNQGEILKKINKLAKILGIPFFLILGAIISLVITMFGKEYPLDWILIGEFSLLGAIFIYFNVLWWLIASKSKAGVKFTSLNGIGSGLIFIFLLTLFRESLTLHYVVLFLICVTAYNISIGNLFYARIK